MSDTVIRSTVIDVLRLSGVEVQEEEDGPPGMMILAKGDYIETRDIPADCGTKLLHYLARKFDVPIHHFFNPHMITAPKKEPSSES